MELSYDDVRKRILIEANDGKPVENPMPSDMIIGQERAVSALEFGLSMKGPGYNIYVSGTNGMGKMTSVRSFLTKLAQTGTTPPDLCCLYNFRDPYEPVIIRLPAGGGQRFAAAMEHLILHISEDLPRAFETDDYSTRREEAMKELVKGREQFSAEINEKAKQRGFSIQPTPMGLLLIPVRNGETMSDEAIAGMSEQEKQELESNRGELQKEIKNGQAAVKKIESETQERINDLDRQITLTTVGNLIDEIRQHFAETEDIFVYLDEVTDDILRNTDLFKTRRADQTAQVLMPGTEHLPNRIDAALSRYRINVMVDNSSTDGAPVVVELNPTYANLIGRLEKELRMGALLADFSLIRGGALAQANGGYLVLPVTDLLRNPWSWEALKRSLRSSELRIEEAGEQFGYITLKTLRPQPVKVSVKIILVGPPELYYLLYSLDPEFLELFKVKADFDTQMDGTRENVRRFVSFIGNLCSKEKLRTLDMPALEVVLQYASRNAEHQEKISANFGNISDVIREADYWAGKNQSDTITDRFIKQALEERVYRSNLAETKIRELMEDRVLVIETSGRKTGQVNGLSVMMLGDYRFGRPNRITAVAGPGREGIIDIERESKLGGPIHTKGVLILSGCLVKKYSTGRPISLFAQIVFEQSYGGIEGDSASQAEFYALISTLTGMPMRQDIAVTGSLDQFGNAQAIGGVNEKIEGFFDVCSVTGFTGTQGVIIPESNRKSLMLRDDVADSVRQGRFHIWTVRNVDEGLELLAGEQAGERRDDGTYPIGTINRKVTDTLRGWEDILALSNGTGKRRQDG